MKLPIRHTFGQSIRQLHGLNRTGNSHYHLKRIFQGTENTQKNPEIYITTTNSTHIFELLLKEEKKNESKVVTRKIMLFIFPLGLTNGTDPSSF